MQSVKPSNTALERTVKESGFVYRRRAAAQLGR